MKFRRSQLASCNISAVALLLFFVRSCLYRARQYGPLLPQDQAQHRKQQQNLAPTNSTRSVAPIALYPDSLLSQALVASTSRLNYSASAMA